MKNKIIKREMKGSIDRRDVYTKEGDELFKAINEEIDIRRKYIEPERILLLRIPNCNYNTLSELQRLSLAERCKRDNVKMSIEMTPVYLDYVEGVPKIIEKQTKI